MYLSVLNEKLFIKYVSILSKIYYFIVKFLYQNFGKKLTKKNSIVKQKEVGYQKLISILFT